MSDQDFETPEEMAAFFDARTDGYDCYIRDDIFQEPTFTQFYEAVSAPIPETEEAIRVLDLGCGTGLEIEALLKRAPQARITGIDLAQNMLEQLQTKYATRMGQIRLVIDSYLTMPLGSQCYDYVISAMSMHHLLHDAKRALYRRIHAALAPGGKYVEGDSVIPIGMEDEFVAEYHTLAAMVSPAHEGYYHIDVPFSIDTQRDLLLESGFTDFELLWERDPSMVWNMAVYVATA
ncbi:MAG: methyltransferase domain-containing protein [Anaerolineae bacterium]|nr:methyltransferase domain-containing protein [Anaerolineae bacterium]